MSLFAAWAWFILGAYVTLLVLLLGRRLRDGKQSALPELLTVSDQVATVFHGARPQSLSGLLVITSSFLWGTVGTVMAYGGVGMLLDLQIEKWSPFGTALMAEIALAVTSSRGVRGPCDGIIDGRSRDDLRACSCRSRA